ncbi:regulator of G-protein signaling 16 [Platysternon megacephalum]|uniref:Regulator of G-protein signaling 16 n=1 Tax=Platysternon megacephalum TaxID=55544 RepID=A0A4D9E894_9SAUR|nr:regulator of G-protein signaling 16 [Platysternon megacephalum]
MAVAVGSLLNDLEIHYESGNNLLLELQARAPRGHMERLGPQGCTGKDTAKSPWVNALCNPARRESARPLLLTCSVPGAQAEEEHAYEGRLGHGGHASSGEWHKQQHTRSWAL